MQLICYPEIHKEASLPVYVTGVGIETPQSSSAHPHFRYPHIMMTVSGRGIFTVNGEVHEMTPGCIFYADRGVEYMSRPLSADWKVDWIAFEYGQMLFPDTLFTSLKTGFFKPDGTEEIAKVFRSVYDAVSFDGFYGGFTASAMLYQLSIRLNREATERPEQKEKVSPAVTAILAYINEHFAEEITLEKLCTAAGGLSEQYLCRLFKQATGMRPVEYVLKKRIGIARAYLEKTDMPITEVAERTGFHNTSYFYRNFKKFTGTSPLTCRQKAINMMQAENYSAGGMR